MAEHPLKPTLKPDAPGLYDRVLERLQELLPTAPNELSKTLLEQQIDEAVEIELTAEEMAQDELDLLKAYLLRDLEQLGCYAHETGESIASWLGFDLNILEQTVLDRLMALADQTRVGQEALRERLASGENQYMAGEVATVGTFICVACNEPQQLRKTGFVAPCAACGSQVFTRKSIPCNG